LRNLQPFLRTLENTVPILASRYKEVDAVSEGKVIGGRGKKRGRGEAPEGEATWFSDFWFSIFDFL
jgi:hypothetical protein